MKSHHSFTLILFGILLFSSCDKHHAKKLEGTYNCQVKYHYWSMSGDLVDSTYSEKLSVGRNGNNLKIFSAPIHIDSLWDENEYHLGNIDNYMLVKFLKDSVYITRSYGGLGSRVTLEYAGLKNK